MLQRKTQKLLKSIARRWNELKAAVPSVIGETYWDNANILWVYITDNEEDYEGHQTQVGVTKDGRLVWEYQSHCSCDGYETSGGTGTEMPEDTTKTYELNQLPADWETKIQENMQKLLG